VLDKPHYCVVARLLPSFVSLSSFLIHSIHCSFLYFPFLPLCLFVCLFIHLMVVVVVVVVGAAAAAVI
jgi:hypothetical protein